MYLITLALLLTPAARAQFFLLRSIRTGGTLARALGTPVRPTRAWLGQLPTPRFFNVILGVGSSRLAIVRGRGARVETDGLNFMMVSAPADSMWTREDPERTLAEPLVMKLYLGGDGVLGPRPGSIEPVLLEIGDDVFQIIDPRDPGPRARDRVPNPCGDRLVDA